MPTESDPPTRSYLDKIKEMYPEEFKDKPLTLKQQLHEIDQIIAIEENYLDKPASVVEVDEAIVEAVNEANGRE